jgi:hypothetical protein
MGVLKALLLLVFLGWYRGGLYLRGVPCLGTLTVQSGDGGRVLAPTASFGICQSGSLSVVAGAAAGGFVGLYGLWAVHLGVRERWGLSCGGKFLTVR